MLLKFFNEQAPTNIKRNWSIRNCLKNSRSLVVFTFTSLQHSLYANLSFKFKAANIKLARQFFIFFVINFITIQSSFTYAATEIDTKKIIEYADRTRGAIPEGLEWTVKLTSIEEEETTDREFFIKYKNNDSYVESKAPVKYKGEIFLFKGRALWYFKPGLRAPISISSRQKLSGAASNGDIASTNYSKDYTATFVKMDTVNNDECYQFHLKSNADDSTYDQIDYWISKKSGLALKADFLSLQGKTLKSAFFKYQNELTYKGEKFPFINEMKITDAKNPKNQSTLNYSLPRVVNHPESIFNVNNLKR